MLRKLGRRVFAAAFVIGMSACTNPTPSDLKPMVAIVTPPDGARYEVGETIGLNVAAVSSQGVLRIELSVDGRIVATQVNPESSVTFSTRIEYAPQLQGRLQLSVVAVDVSGTASAPYTITLMVGEEPTPIPLPPVETTPVIGLGGCILAAGFLEDVNIPDGTQIAAGATFTKTWRMRNTSTCDWGEGYTIAFFSDTPMHPTGSEPIRPTPSNGIVEISVPLTAPTQSGAYTTTWRLKDPAGRFFGNRVFAMIRVP